MKKIEKWTRDEISIAVNDYIQESGLKVGEVMWPMRVSLTGRQASPGPFEVAEVLGREKSLRRIELASI